MRYIIKNSNDLYLMAVDFNEYAFTTNVKLAIKFITKEGADAMCRKLSSTGMFKNLSSKIMPCEQ